MTAAREPDAGELAQAVISRLASQRFVGVLEFVCEMYVEHPHGTRGVCQHGRLYLGPAGQVRLDVRTESQAAPIVCCVRPGESWMVWSDNPVMVRSRYPVPAGPTAGDLRQLEFQVGQTLHWADLLLSCGLRRARGVAPAVAELHAGRLAAELVATPGQVEVAALEANWNGALGAYLPAEIVYANGVQLRARRWQRSATGVLWSGELERVGVDTGGRINHARWVITDVRELPAHDPALAGFFAAPPEPTPAFPGLVGCATYDAEARAVAQVLAPRTGPTSAE